MNIMILTEGGRNFGFGHITRCIGLYQAFEEKGIVPKFIVNSDNSSLDLLKDKNFQIFNWLEKKNKLFKTIANADVVIIDSYLATKSLYDEIFESTVGRLVMLDDYNRLDYPKGIVINPSIHGDKINYAKRNDTVYLLGKDYVILRKEFWNVPRKKINKKVKNLLITFGGMNYSNLSNKIIGYLKNHFDFNFYIAEPKKNRYSGKEMLKLMLKADICVSGGGQTTYELARVGAPTIAICFAENQLGNLRWFAKENFVRFGGWFHGKNLLDRIKRYIIECGYSDRLKMCQNGQRCIDGKGVNRIINFLCM